uniref:Uncharacterized protein n=1 Tax=termite gut metagenome TaxID=433724 RepID=S0DE10_9ZZZZ
MKKIVNIILIALLAIAVIPLILWIGGVFGPFAHSNDVFGGADIMLIIAAAYLLVAVAVMIVMTAMNVGKGRSSSRLSLYVFGGLAVVAVVLYFTLASAALVTGADGKVFDNAFTLKISDTMLYLAYAALGLTVIFLLWGEVRKALK